MIPWALYEFLVDALPQGTTVLLRRGQKTAPGDVEQLVRHLVREQAHHLEVRWMMPEPGGGAGAAFNRDNEMVAKSDLVLAFFAEGHEMSGGTGHVVETAIDRNVPVYSFLVTDMSENFVQRLGDHDPEALWQETIGAYFQQ